MHCTPNTRSGRLLAGVLATALGLTLAGCGYYDVRTRAYEMALGNLEENVPATVACLEPLVPDVLSARDDEELAEDLSPCMGTGIMNRDDEFIRTIDISGPTTVVVSSRATSRRVALTVATHGSGLAEAGVDTHRVTLLTCWQLTVERDTGALGAPTGTTCRESVVARLSPTDVLPLGDLELRDTATREEQPAR